MKALKFLVVGMGVLLLVGFTALVILLFQKFTSSPTIVSDNTVQSDHQRDDDNRPKDNQTKSGAYDQKMLNVPPQSQILQIHADQGRLVLWIHPPQGPEFIVIIDLSSGQELQRYLMP